MQSYSFKWWHAIVAYGSYLIAIMINSLLATFLQDRLQNLNFNVGALFNVTLFALAGIICLLLFRLISKQKLTTNDFWIHRTSILKSLTIGSLLGGIFFALSEIVEANNQTLREAGEQVMNEFNIGQNFTNDSLLILGTCLFAPVVEEIIFRGGIFNPLIQFLKKFELLPKWAYLLIAMGISSFAFVSIHGGGGQTAQLGLLAVLSCFACLAMYFTKSLFGAIFVHAVNNVAVLLYSIYKQFGTDSSYGLKLAVMALACLAFSYPLTILFGRILPSYKTA